MGRGGRVQKGFSEDVLKYVLLARGTREKVSEGNIKAMDCTDSSESCMWSLQLEG